MKTVVLRCNHLSSGSIKIFRIMGLLILISFFSSEISKPQSLLREPQKIVIDSRRNRLLVSNYATGDIVQIDSAGIQSYFVRRAGFIDGIEVVGDTVYGVANNRKVKAYDLVTGLLVMDVAIPGIASKYLSSITSDSSGHLFISCPQSNIIYKLRISDKSYWVFAQDNGLNKPNGILLEKEKNRIVVIGDASNSSIYAISLADSMVSTLMTTTLYNPDGIVRDKYCNYYIGGYYLPGIYKTDSNFSQTPQLIFAGANIVYPTYDQRDHSLLVTYYHANAWGRVPLTSTGINQKEVKKRFNLFQNYPNPFNSSTTIHYDFPVSGNVCLGVYNIHGQLVRTLVNGQYLAGQYHVTWDSRNEQGQSVSSGAYICRIQADDFIKTHRMILMK